MKIEPVPDVLLATRYMTAELADGTTLARLALQTIDFSKGRFRVAVPKELDENQALDFRYDMHTDGDEEVALARLIKAFIIAPNHAVLIQEYCASPSDSWLRECEYRQLVRLCNNEVYWAVEGAELARVSDDEMLNIVHLGSFHPFSCFFHLRNSCGGEAGSAGPDLNRVAQSLFGVAVDAFDARSFLIWWRDDFMPFPL